MTTRGFFLMSVPEELEELGADDVAFLEHVRDTGNVACGTLGDLAPVEADAYGRRDVTEQDFSFVPPAHRVEAFTREERELERARKYRAHLKRSRAATERQRHKRAMQREELRASATSAHSATSAEFRSPPQPEPEPSPIAMPGPYGYRAVAMYLPELGATPTWPQAKTIHDVRAGRAGRVVRATPYRRPR